MSMRLLYAKRMRLCWLYLLCFLMIPVGVQAHAPIIECQWDAKMSVKDQQHPISYAFMVNLMKDTDEVLVPFEYLFPDPSSIERLQDIHFPFEDVAFAYSVNMMESFWPFDGIANQVGIQISIGIDLKIQNKKVRNIAFVDPTKLLRKSYTKDRDRFKERFRDVDGTKWVLHFDGITTCSMVQEYAGPLETFE